MASAITHFLVGAALALPAVQSNAIAEILPQWAIPVSAGLLAAAPDLDTFLGAFVEIPYDSFFGHRGFFHSPLFLLAGCTILAAIANLRRPWKGTAWLAALWGGCAVTHPLLDAMTDGGLGVMLLLPLSADRLFLPWRPIHVSPLSIPRFFDHAGYILRSELPFCAAAAVIGAAGLLLRTGFERARR